MNALRTEFPVRMLCEVIGLASSSFYYQGQPAADADLRAAIEAIALEYPR